MKADVIAKYRDKLTGQIHNVGDVVEVTEERFSEINSAYEGVTFLAKKSAARSRASKAKANDSVESVKSSTKRG